MVLCLEWQHYIYVLCQLAVPEHALCKQPNGCVKLQIYKISSVCVWRGKRNFILVPASVCGIATTQCSSSARHLHVPGRSGPIAIAALFLLLLTLGNYTPKGIKRLT